MSNYHNGVHKAVEMSIVLFLANYISMQCINRIINLNSAINIYTIKNPNPKAVVNVEPVIEVLDRESVGEGGVEVVVVGLVLVVHAAVQLPIQCSYVTTQL